MSTKKGQKKYNEKVVFPKDLKWDDLMSAAVKPVDHEKKNVANKKRATGKKK